MSVEQLYMVDETELKTIIQALFDHCKKTTAEIQLPDGRSLDLQRSKFNIFAKRGNLFCILQDAA